MTLSRFLLCLVVIGALGGQSHAQNAKQKAEAKAHFEQAEIFMQAGVFDKAIEEYNASYALAPNLHVLLFNIGLAYEKWGKPDEAQVSYKKYMEADPKGPKATEAQARSLAIDRARDQAKADAEAAAKRKEADEAQRKANDEQRKRDAEETAQRIFAENKRLQEVEEADPLSWTWVGIGAAALGAGILLDTIPSSGSNKKLDGTDFIPVAFYGAATTFVFIGVF